MPYPEDYPKLPHEKSTQERAKRHIEEPDDFILEKSDKRSVKDQTKEEAP